MEGDVWRSFAHDPRDPAVASLRASDADREVIHGILAEAFADGRLDRAEYDERSTAALGARTLGELPPVVADLVPNLPARTASGHVPLVAATAADLQRRADEKWRGDRREALLGFVGSALVTWTIWAAVMFGGFPWPLFVNFFALMNLLRVATSRSEIVRSEVRRLEKKQARELEKKQREQ